jgi:Domain of unknown function (DUF6504)
LSAPELRPVHFFDEPIRVSFHEQPARQKVPHCPDGFTWGDRTYRVLENLSEWKDFARRGRTQRNMSAEHALAAAERGSLNVGRFFFRVRVDSAQIFDIYYDRAIKNVDDRKGGWFIYRELSRET